MKLLTLFICGLLAQRRKDDDDVIIDFLFAPLRSSELSLQNLLQSLQRYGDSSQINKVLLYVHQRDSILLCLPLILKLLCIQEILLQLPDHLLQAKIQILTRIVTTTQAAVKSSHPVHLLVKAQSLRKQMIPRFPKTLLLRLSEHGYPCQLL